MSLFAKLRELRRRYLEWRLLKRLLPTLLMSHLAHSAMGLPFGV